MFEEASEFFNQHGWVQEYKNELYCQLSRGNQHIFLDAELGIIRLRNDNILNYNKEPILHNYLIDEYMRVHKIGLH